MHSMFLRLAYLVYHDLLYNLILCLCLMDDMALSMVLCLVDDYMALCFVDDVSLALRLMNDMSLAMVLSLVDDYVALALLLLV